MIATTVPYADPLDRATLGDEVQAALALVLETLTPVERPAFVLHDVFGFRSRRSAKSSAVRPRPCISSRAVLGVRFAVTAGPRGNDEHRCLPPRAGRGALHRRLAKAMTSPRWSPCLTRTSTATPS
jgi:hypothetical protein